MDASDPVVEELRPYFSRSVNGVIDRIGSGPANAVTMALELASIHPDYADGLLGKVAGREGSGEILPSDDLTEVLLRILRNHDLAALSADGEVVVTRSVLIDLGEIDRRVAELLPQEVLDALRTEVGREYRRTDGPSGFELPADLVLAEDLVEVIQAAQTLAVRADEPTASATHLLQALTLMNGERNEVAALFRAASQDRRSGFGWLESLQGLTFESLLMTTGQVVSFPPLLLDPDLDGEAKHLIERATVLASRYNERDVEDDGRRRVRVRDLFGATLQATTPAARAFSEELWSSVDLPRRQVEKTYADYLADPTVDFAQFLAEKRHLDEPQLDVDEYESEDPEDPDDPDDPDDSDEQLLAGFHHDDTRGRNLLDEDQLDIKPHVQAFALLMASTDLKPPLATGLFGDWGSGKTFFMRALRQEVDRITALARESGLDQHELPVYRNVVQIEFNAWHYVDADLWASLADYIFANLRVGEEEEQPDTERRRRQYVEELKQRGAALRQAEAERRRLEAQVVEAGAESERVRATVAHEQDLFDIARAAVTADDDTKQQADGLIEEAGLPAVGDSALELRSAVADAAEVASRGHDTVNVLAGRYGSRWLVVAILALLAGPAVLAISGAIDLSAVSRVAATLAALIAGAAGFVRAAAAAGTQTIDHIEAVQRKLEEEIDGDAAVVAAERRVTTTAEQLVEARAAEVTAREALSQVTEELRRLAPERRLADFIVSRRDSDDYRKHLGLASVIRRDFDELTELIEEFNSSIKKPPADRSPDESDHADDGGYKINRIVLYIDDLDRCPPETVVEVLQAVHLLLAFPLFVVVVGVDARWLARSLEKHYGSLLGADEEAPKTDDAPSASPHDYLEKIFQIPFWLRPMSEDAQLKLLTALTADSTGAAAGTSDGGDDGAAGEAEPEQDDGAGDDVEAVVVEQPLVARPAAATEPPDQAASIAATGHGSLGLAGGPSDPPTTVPVEHAATIYDDSRTYDDIRTTPIAISSAELEFMASIRPLLGRSPRSLTRFVNVYRLLKAADQTDRAKVPAADAEQNKRVLMFLLAIVTGLPLISSTIFGAIAGGGSVSLDEFVENTAPSALGPETRQWGNLRRWLTENPTWGAPAISGWRGPASKVARYSYRIDQM